MILSCPSNATNGRYLSSIPLWLQLAKSKRGVESWSCIVAYSHGLTLRFVF
jgi:hypothetical protein